MADRRGERARPGIEVRGQKSEVGEDREQNLNWFLSSEPLTAHFFGWNAQ